jgi:outer membrane protein OmpA-like peptidoglycan-associated protein
MDANSKNVAIPENYEISGLMSYVSLISAVRISLPYEDWFVYAGPIFEFRQYNTIVHNTELDNVSSIKQERIANIPNVNNRIGFHGGIGFEYLIANVVDLFRIKFSPYLAVSTGQDVFGTQTNNSNPTINTFTFQTGINLKFGPDEITYDTLRFDPTYIAPSSAYARVADEKGVSGNGFIKQEQIGTSNLSLVEGSKIKEQVREEPVFAQEIAKEKKETVPENKVDISINKQMIFYYPNSTTTELSNSLREYLNAASDYLKANPNYEMRIVAHTDNIGTEEEKQKTTDDRGRVIRRYLISKGINGSKIFSKGLGDREPIANSRTEEGRRKNRRVEIIIAPK